MGVSGVQRIQTELLTGLPAHTPVAVIQNASLPHQRHIVTRLSELLSTQSTLRGATIAPTDPARV